MSSNYKLDQDLKEAVKMAEGLDDYIRQDELYGNIGGGFFSGGNMPKLTVGALLLRLRRLDAMRTQMTADQHTDLRNAQENLRRVRKEWNMHYEQKLVREALSRLEAMRAFFRECTESKSLCANIYKPELLRRTIVQEILLEMKDQNIQSEEVDKTVKDIDGKLRGFIVKADFQWSDELAPLYPPADFWWLYAAPPVPVGQ